MREGNCDAENQATRYLLKGKMFRFLSRRNFFQFVNLDMGFGS
jgi:hypothetical protein